jgi:hypothetical protein
MYDGELSKPIPIVCYQFLPGLHHRLSDGMLQIKVKLSNLQNSLIDQSIRQNMDSSSWPTGYLGATTWITVNLRSYLAHCEFECYNLAHCEPECYNLTHCDSECFDSL